jgi:uncharacterized protein involved in exopolysaccharide biosynthesis
MLRLTERIDALPLSLLASEAVVKGASSQAQSDGPSGVVSTVEMKYVQPQGQNVRNRRSQAKTLLRFAQSKWLGR